MYKQIANINFILLLGVASLLLFGPLISYEVEFEGIKEPKLLNLLRETSQLVKLKESPPQTKIGLKRRAEADLPNIKKGLQSLGYYSPTLSFRLSEDYSTIFIKVDEGPIFPLEAFKVRYFQNGAEVSEELLKNPISLSSLNIRLGEAALPDKILSAEDTLLDKLNLQGFAFATILKRDVFVDEKEKKIIVLIMVEIGPLATFGRLDIEGLKKVKRSFILKKLRWQIGEIYDPLKIEKTQEALELSALFRSVSISSAAEPINDNEVVMDIHLREAKRHSIGFGLNYNNELGFGASGEWENRNMFGEGEKLSLRTEIWQKLQDGKISYLIPDFKKQDQSLIFTIDYHTDHIKSYREQAFSVSTTIERKLSDKLDYSYGAMYKFLRSEHSARNGTFDLLKTPIQVRWNGSDNILDPSKGTTLVFRTIPTLEVDTPTCAYWINSVTGTYYQSLDKEKKHILALKLMVGSIFGGAKREVPAPERFLAGSETTIRGYRFLTVSPLGKNDKPLGGRSLFVYNLELRNRLSKGFGAVLFYDMGNVYIKGFPLFTKGLLHSAGLGIRYYTPVGPIRFDIAFPFNRRKKTHGGWFDRVVEVYFSIGQAF